MYRVFQKEYTYTSVGAFNKKNAIQPQHDLKINQLGIIIEEQETPPPMLGTLLKK